MSVDIETASVDTREPARDTHLRSQDFFESEKFPHMSFRSTGFAGDQNGEFEILGDLTIRNVTHPVRLATSFNGAGKDPWGGLRRGYTAKTRVNRTNFGLTWNAALELGGVLVDENVDITLDVEIVAR